MNLTLSEVFFVYLAVFLAVIFFAWLFFGWQRRRAEQSDSPVLTCACCGTPFRTEQPFLRVRCPRCGATQDPLFPPAGNPAKDPADNPAPPPSSPA